MCYEFRISPGGLFALWWRSQASIASWLLLTHTYFFLHPLFFIHVKYACLNAIWWPNGEPQLLTSMHFQQHCRTGSKYIFTCSTCNKYVWNSKNLKHTKNQTCRSLYSFQIWNKLKPWPYLNMNANAMTQATVRSPVLSFISHTSRVTCYCRVTITTEPRIEPWDLNAFLSDSDYQKESFRSRRLFGH